MKGKNIFLDVAKKIKKRVDDKIYIPGQRLPSEYDMAAEFNVSRLTVRKAIEFLCQRNVLVKEKGKGTYVMKHSKIPSGQQGLVGFAEAAKEQGKTARTDILSIDYRVKVPKEIMTYFKGYEKEHFVRILRKRCLENDPLVLEEAYVLERYIQESTEEELKYSLFQIMEQTVEIGYSHQEIEAILANRTTAKALEIKENQPVLLVYSMTYTPSSQPLLYSISHYRADRYSFVNTLVRHKFS